MVTRCTKHMLTRSHGGWGAQADNLCFTTNPNLELKFRSGPPCQESQSHYTQESCELILRPLALFSSQESPKISGSQSQKTRSTAPQLI